MRDCKSLHAGYTYKFEKNGCQQYHIESGSKENLAKYLEQLRIFSLK